MSHSHKGKNKKPFYATPFAPGAKLQIRPIGHAFEHNAIAWVENYRTQTKLGSYSAEIARMGMAMQFTLYDEETETLKYPLEEELYTNMSEWTPTLVQIDQLRQIEDPLVREHQRVTWYQEWATPRREQNIEIRKRNLQNSEKLKRIPREAQKARDLYAKVFQEMEADMTESAREIVRQTVVTRTTHSEDRVELRVNITYEDAKKSWDFIWLLEAAIHGLVKRGANIEDEHEMHARKEEFRRKIKEFKQGAMEWSAYCLALKRQWEHADHLGIEIDEPEKVAILMANINPEIFRHQIVAFHDPNQRRILGYFKSYESLIEALSAVVRSTPDAVLIRTQGRERRETSFVSEEKSEDSKDIKPSCHICGAWGKLFHVARECPFKHPKKSVSENVAYYRKHPKALEERKKKLKLQQDSAVHKGGQQYVSREQAEPVSPRQGSAVTQGAGRSSGSSRPSNARPQEAALLASTSVEPSYTILDIDEGNQTTPEYSFISSRRTQRGVGRDEIDLVLDTASIPNVLRPEDGVLLSQITNDRVSLIGIGNSVVVSESSGYSVFGKTRIMNQGHNLVSQYQTKDRYKIV